ncbi:MAG TPA: putative inorganic carbon transporter subunit DabA, partial [Polyangiaceae bacterium LLY-WYZ-15_(1-7)]|nr:putative inorganic carbon transporter subunit DabA [Polyangiaceae bacterium LLY-WYZ-15_(1-7)]
MTAPTESTASILPALRRAAAQVAPAWPLDRFVAVNPYFGVADRPFEEAAARLARAAGARVTMPRAFYAEAVRSGAIRAEDLAAALEQLGAPASVDEVLALLERGEESSAPAPAPTVADVAASETGRDWPTLVVERVAFWAGAYFDQGQAAWASPDRGAGLWEAWRREAEIDRAPEVSGVRGFRRVVRALPASPVAAAEVALRRLEVPADGLDLYLHRLLMRVGGWAAFAARRPFESALEGREDDTLVELLAVLLTWELALLEAFGAPVQAAWAEARHGLGVPDALPAGRRVDLALQVAFERGALRELVGTLEGARADAELSERPRVQAVFCIDVRSEVFRRALESVDSRVETLGFAGFFAFPIEYVPLAHEEGGAHCPVLLTPGHRVHEALPEAEAHAAAVERRRQKRGAKDAWTAFKMGAISCFSFVGPVGLAYAAKLFTDAFGRSRPVPHPSTAGLGADASRAKGPRLAPSEADDAASGLDLEARVELAAGALGAMSLTEGFARIVLVTGHGSSTVNNPHATSLDCGACGGRTGEASARVAAAVLNDPAVRAALVERAIAIPEDTVFVPALHDTTTDEVTLYDRAAVPESHRGELAELEGWLTEAGRR